jgi:hypothetical protein
MTETNDIDLLNAVIHAMTGDNYGELYLEDDQTNIGEVAIVDISDGHMTVRVVDPRDRTNPVATHQFDITDEDQ